MTLNDQRTTTGVATKKPSPATTKEICYAIKTKLKDVRIFYTA